MRIAYIYEAADTSTFRYRVFNMVEALRCRPDLGVSATWFTRAEYRADQSFVDSCDVLVVCRTRYDDGLARLVERARSRGVSVVFDIDDFVIDPRYVHYIMEVLAVSPELETNWDYWYSYIGRLRAAFDLCDAAITTTKPLADRLDEIAGRKLTAVVPNFLNRTQSEVSANLLEQKQRSGWRRDGRVTVGFLSGSPTHGRDFAVAAPALTKVLEQFHQLDLRVVGFLDSDWLAPSIDDRIEYLPLQDYLNLQRVTAECELCIVPLSLNEFSRCKSELKFFEAGAVGCPIIASPSPAYQTAISDGLNGWLAHTHQWQEKLEHVLELIAADTDQFRSVGAQATSSAVDRYAWNSQGPRIVETMDWILSLTG